MRPFILLIFILFTQLGFCQKTTVAMLPFSNSTGYEAEASAIYQKVKQAFVETNRFDIVDRNNVAQISKEKEFQKTEAFLNSANRVDQENTTGAQQLIAGSLNAVEYVKKATQKGVIYYECTVIFTLEVLDVETSQVIHTKTITPKDSFMGNVLGAMGGNNTPAKAFGSSMRRMQKYIDKFIEEYFPISTSIIEIQNIKKDEAKTILLNVGSQAGTKKKDKFFVYEISSLEVSGKTIRREEKIGELKIELVEGAEISVAKVLKGGKEILAKFKANAQLICKSTL